MAYAEKTSVSVERTKAQIEAIVNKYGAESFGSHTNAAGTKIMFEMQGRRILFRLPLPDREEKRFTMHSRGRRTTDAALAQWEQACRSKWRALFLSIKAKLESIESGIETFDDAFMPQIDIGGGVTIGDELRPRLDQITASGEMPSLLAIEDQRGPLQ